MVSNSRIESRRCVCLSNASFVPSIKPLGSRRWFFIDDFQRLDGIFEFSHPYDARTVSYKNENAFVRNVL